MNAIRSKISSLPREPGVYFMKDASAKVIYVGKAKDLKSRVSSYFTDSKDHSPKTRRLVRQIVDFEIMIVGNEVEALLLERTLIKHHQPHYNILLRDDKEYPYIRVHFEDEWPRLEVVRRRKDDGAEYFGPFSAAGSLRQGLEAVSKVFPLIRCSEWEFKHAKRVCSYYHMKMCLGPCVNKVPKEIYHVMIRDAVDLIFGKNNAVELKIMQRMEQAASIENFELAAQFRDQLKAIEQLKEKQSVMLDPTIDADIIGCRRSQHCLFFQVLMVRGGKLLGGNTFKIKEDVLAEDDTLRSSEISSDELVQFILQYFDGRDLPKKIVCEISIPDHLALVKAISANTESQTTFVQDKESKSQPWSELFSIISKNLDYQINESSKVQERNMTSLESLQKTINLSTLPKRIECIDISNLQNTAIVASNVCFIDGNPEKSLYRSYNINTLVDHHDDFQSIFEVVSRRLRRGITDHDLPDLLVIDGGKGQLDAALKALAEFPGLNLNIVSLAKSRSEKSSFSKAKSHKKDSSRSFERIFIPGADKAIPLVPGSPTYRIMTRLRDEAHRFAITKHRSKRNKISTSSPLEAIPGVGPKVRANLLIAFESMEGIARASLEQLKKVKGVSTNTAERIFAALKD